MEPRIQYVKSKEGVRIACWTEGEGKPLVYLPTPVFGVTGMRQLPEVRSFRERIGDGRKFVGYSARGTDQSDRGVADYSLDAQVADLEAVADRFAGERFDLMGIYSSSPIAIAYAARNPERVEHLILWNPWASGRDFADSPRIAGLESMRSMAERNWNLFCQTSASLSFMGASAESIRLAAQVMAESVTPQDFIRIFEALTRYDVTELLEHIRPPTLVLMWAGLAGSAGLIDARVVQGVAAGIANAQLVVSQNEPTMFLGGADALISTIRDFLGDETKPAPSKLSSGTAVILFADIADSTALTERLGDADFRAKARDLDAALRTVIRDHAGTPIEGKLLGDGVLAVFTSARQAIEAALACARSGDDAGLPLHLGLHAGDVIREDNNVYGGAVNIASRIAGLSAAGEVLVSETVRSLARTSAGVQFEDRGEQPLKGVGEPVRVWAVRGGE